MNNDIFTKLENIVKEAEESANEAVKIYGEAFTSCVRLEIQNIPLDDFKILTENQSISIKSYDASEGTNCLTARLRLSSWGEVLLSSNEITEPNKEKE